MDRGIRVLVTVAVASLIAASACSSSPTTSRTGSAVAAPMFSAEGARSPTKEPETGLPPHPKRVTGTVPAGPLASIVYKIPTTQPLVFLTIDDGYVRDPEVINFIRTRHLPVTVFLINAAGHQDPSYFRALQSAGATIEDHTLTHPQLPTLALADQKHEICGAADDEAQTYAARPTLMRPPYGLEDRVTQFAAAACRMKAVVEWTAVVDNAHLTAVGGQLRPGYIVLLHFRATLLADLQAALVAAQAAGLGVGRLETYLP